MSKCKPTSDALEIIDRRFFQGQPERLVELEEARANDVVARKVVALRIEAGLTQAQLAKRIGTTPEIVGSLEEGEYAGNALAILNRIAAALEQRVEINFIPLSHARPT